MNLNKIEKLLKVIGNELKGDAFTDEEYLVLVANLLFKFGEAGLDQLNKHPEVNIEDAFSIELASNQAPNDVHLAALLQSHAILKWSESFKE